MSNKAFLAIMSLIVAMLFSLASSANECTLNCKLDCLKKAHNEVKADPSRELFKLAKICGASCKEKCAMPK
jgi:hypothetical protein